MAPLSFSPASRRAFVSLRATLAVAVAARARAFSSWAMA
jgi:hypothetical protein